MDMIDLGIRLSRTVWCGFFCIKKGYREERGKLKVQLNWKESSYGKLPELHIAASEIVAEGRCGPDLR